MTINEARAILLNSPGAEEGEHMGHPDFRVGGKIFATLWPMQGRAVLRLPPAFAESLLCLEEPDLKIVSRSGRMVWLSVPCASVESAEFRDWAEVAFAERS